MAASDAGRAGSDRRLAWCAAVLVVLSLPALTRAALTIPGYAPLDHNEGWNAYVADRVASGRPLYPDTPRLFVTNYPPLSFYAVGLLPAADHIAAGRTLSLAAFVVWALLLGATARRLGCSRAEAAFAAALFAALMLAVTSYVGMNDPQMLGHVPQALALLIVAAPPRTAPRLAAAAVLLAAGVFVKHNLIALPLAVVACLLATDPRAGRRLLAAGAICAVAGWIVCTRAYGPGFFAQLAMTRSYRLADTGRAALLWTVRMPVFAALVAWLARRGARDEPARLAVVYAAIATVLGLIFFGGAGVDWNVLFDANAACCLAAAVALHRIVGERRPLVAVACMLLPAIAALASARGEWLSRAYWLAPRSAEAADARREVAFIAARPGPALCADLAFCWRAGKPLEVDAWGLGQRGRRDPALFDAAARLVEQGYYGVIQIDRPLEWGARFETALAANYRVDHDSRFGTFLVRAQPP